MFRPKLLFCLLTACCLSASLSAQDSLHLHLLGEYDRGDGRYSGSWAYVDPAGSEYALLGTRFGVAAYWLDGPDGLQEVGFLPGPTSNWREITVVGQHAYVVTEGDGDLAGMHVVDLSYLPDSLHLTAVYDSTFTRAHMIQKDLYADQPLIFVCGTSATQGIHLLDVSDPAHPVEIGLYQPGYYIHDIHVRGDRLYAAAFYEDQVDILDISDPALPTWMAALEDPGNNTHSMSTTPDGRYLFLADEQDGLPGRLFDLDDLADIQEVGQYSANLESLVHNPYIRGDYAFVSHNTEGLRVVDLRDPTVPVEVGHYDTFDGPSGGFFGLWSACPYLPSGRIVGGDRTRGLLVWEFDTAFAGRFYGQVFDAVSGLPVVNARIGIGPTSDTLYSGLDGKFRGGGLPGAYTLSVEAEGYSPTQVQLQLAAKDSLYLEIYLEPETAVGLSGPGSGNSPCRGAWSTQGQSWRLDCPELTGVLRLGVYGLDGRLVRQWKASAGQAHWSPHVGLPAGWYVVVAADERGRILHRQLVWRE